MPDIVVLTLRRHRHGASALAGLAVAGFLAWAAACGAAEPQAPDAPDLADATFPIRDASGSGGASATATAVAQGRQYALRQAVIALDMLAKVTAICPGGRDDTARTKDLERIARARLKVSVNAFRSQLDEQSPSVFMTPEQAVRVVRNAGGCESPELAQWRGRAAWLADTSQQVLAGDARANRFWPRDAALEGPVRMTILGQVKDGEGGRGVMARIQNDAAAPVQVALLRTQTYIGPCTGVQAEGIPLAEGYLPARWQTIAPRMALSVRLSAGAACALPPRMNVGGTLAVDDGRGARYWQFLNRSVGMAPMAHMPERPSR
ncbi:hypothetical protein CAL14_16455 [Bordetella genomosp. 9]|uniref:hypothetical protein n=1 Tax=Bordetella genomosp. 9 TaxID=1416803 RepID=UPI000A29468B|nr:hypothetical protein [Bordetella genomosp. 9]ARP91681.1 hypothetical protein CAL14_16455 [Bordetella genomosp. 9]